MPVCLRPGGSYPYVLKEDRLCESTQNQRFLLRHLSYDDQVRIGAIYDEAIKADAPEAMRDKLRQVIGEVLVGWELKYPDGNTVEFHVDKSTSILSFAEVTELANAAMVNGRVNYEEKKS